MVDEMIQRLMDLYDEYFSIPDSPRKQELDKEIKQLCEDLVK